MKKTAFSTKAELPQPTRVNKFVVITVAIFCAILIGLALISAFQAPEVQQTTQKLQVNSDDRPVVDDQIQQLPSDYSQHEKIQSILDAGRPKTVTIPPQVKQELFLLKQQQAMLQQRLESLNREDQHSENTNNLQDRQAEESGLFFPGAAPKSFNPAIAKTGDQSTSKDQDNAGSAGHQSSYEKQNMQSQKIQFLKAADTPKDIYNIHSLVKPISPYEIQAGSIIPAVLLTAINSSLPGSVVAQVSEDIYDSVNGGFLLIPKGSRVIGEYDSKVSYGQQRVLIAFTRIIRPDGSSILLSKTAGSDLKGEAGLKGNVDNHWMRILGAATLSTILSVGTGIASDNTGNDNTYYRSAEQNAILSGANNVSQVGQQLTGRAMDIQPTLSIPAGFEFNIIVQKDMVLDPYKS